MMGKQLGRLAAIFLLMACALAGCKREQQEPVRANATYERYFGSAPLTPKGVCYARVGFLPLRENPAVATPIPLFLFRAENQMELLVQRLLALEDFGFRDKGVFNPFVRGSRLKGLQRDGGRVTLDLALDEADLTPPTVIGMVSSLGNTVSQFKGVRQLILTANGQPLPGLDPKGINLAQLSVTEPGPPRLLLAVGTWEKEPSASEVLFNFDRPVTVEKVKITFPAGQELKGDYFQSAFDMAVVVHPDPSLQLLEGSVLGVDWTVIDGLGRRASGKGEYPLFRPPNGGAKMGDLRPMHIHR